jgi:Domain of unknown function (DUF6894)
VLSRATGTNLPRLMLRCMGLYYFDIQIGDAARSVDEVGESFPDIDMARTEAGLALCSLGRDMMQSGRTISDITIWVRDELGEVMHARLEFRMSRVN